MKRKLFIALLAFVCALTCAFGFVACGDDKKSDGTGTEQGGSGTEQGGETGTGQGGGTTDKKDTAKVTADEWTQIIGSVDNYTATSTQGSVNSIVKVDKDKFEMNATGQKMIYVKDGSSYYVYTYANSTWMRMGISEQMYKPMADSMEQSVGVFKDKMSEFTYADGVYTAATLSAEVDNETIDFANVKIKFENGKLISLEYDVSVGADGTVHGVLNEVGTTKVEVPAQYTEINMPSM